MTGVNERFIQMALAADSKGRYRQGRCMPNFTPKGWWECDLAYLTKSGYLHEFEIKLTTSDFRKDAEKVESHPWNRRQRKALGLDLVTKHQRLAERRCVPNHFWFVTVPGVTTLDQIPEWAGWIEIEPRTSYWYSRQKVHKRAPKLHSNKADDSVEKQMLQSAYYRLFDRMIKDCKTLKEK